MSLVSGIVGAIKGADAQKKASDQQRQSVKDTNYLNLMLSLLGRGASLTSDAASRLNIPPEMAGSGSSLFPIYMKDASGGSWESSTYAPDIMDAWAAMSANIDPSKYAGITAGYQPMQAQAGEVARSLFDGGMQSSYLSNLAPVNQARVELANAQKQAALEGGNAAVNQFMAQQAAKGFTGDSYANLMARSKIARDAATQGAAALSAANLDNAMAEQGIRDKILGAQLENVQLPYNMIKLEGDAASLPTRLYSDEFLSAARVPNLLNIGTGQMPNMQTPQYSAVASPFQLAAQGMGQFGNTALNAWLQKKQQDDYMKAAKEINTSNNVYNSWKPDYSAWGYLTGKGGKAGGDAFSNYAADSSMAAHLGY